MTHSRSLGRSADPRTVEQICNPAQQQRHHIQKTEQAPEIELPQLTLFTSNALFCPILGIYQVYLSQAPVSYEIPEQRGTVSVSAMTANKITFFLVLMSQDWFKNLENIQIVICPRKETISNPGWASGHLHFF